MSIIESLRVFELNFNKTNTNDIVPFFPFLFLFDFVRILEDQNLFGAEFKEFKFSFQTLIFRLMEIPPTNK